jgi:hypothetical protein
VRLILIAAVLICAGAAAYLYTGARNSFSSYSGDQLDLLEHELGTLEQGEGEAFSKSLLEAERRRRVLFPVSLGIGLLAALGAYVSPAVRIRVGGKGSSAEEQRLMSALGDPGVALQGAKNKAATLLGVTPNAPASVIEAALEAQLKERDLSRLDGLAADLHKVVIEQREELIRARDLLLKKG